MGSTVTELGNLNTKGEIENSGQGGGPRGGTQPAMVRGRWLQ